MHMENANKRISEELNKYKFLYDSLIPVILSYALFSINTFASPSVTNIPS